MVIQIESTMCVYIIFPLNQRMKAQGHSATKLKSQI